MSEADQWFLDALEAVIPEGSGWTARDVAAKAVVQWESEPLFLAWRDQHIVQVVTDRVSTVLRSRRASTYRQAKARWFAEATDDPQQVAYLAEHYEVDEAHTRKCMADMTGADHTFVANYHATRARSHLLEEAFHRVLAEQVRDRRTGDVLTNEQIDDLRRRVFGEKENDMGLFAEGKEIFGDYHKVAWPFRFHAKMVVQTLAGGTPSDPKVAEGWLRSKVEAPDDVIRREIIRTMAERQCSRNEAVKIVDDMKHLTGFRQRDGVLQFGGYQIKAAIKESANIAFPTKVWGDTRKRSKGFFTEHVFVEEDWISLRVPECHRVHQQFVHADRGRNAIQYYELVDDAELEFHIVSDYDYSDEDWGRLWLCVGHQGVGAGRPLGFGLNKITEWRPE